MFNIYMYIRLVQYPFTNEVYFRASLDILSGHSCELRKIKYMITNIKHE